jgi:hypothetical protein
MAGLWMGVVLDLPKARAVGHPPELEDHQPDWLYVRASRSLGGHEFFTMLESVAREDLAEVFGPDLTRRGATAAITVGGGKASLGCVTCEGTRLLRVVPRPGKPDQVRLAINDPALGPLDLPVTDIRLYGADHVTPDRKVIHQVANRLKGREKVILAVGVGRPYPPPPAADSAHWLQVNNLHFADDPVWQLK